MKDPKIITDEEMYLEILSCNIRKVLKKSIIITVTIGFGLFLFLASFLYSDWNNFSKDMHTTMVLIIVAIIFIVGGCIAMWWVVYDTWKNLEINEFNEKLVDACFELDTSEKYVRVVPKKKDTFTYELIDMAEYFARKTEDNENIEVFIQFNHEKGKLRKVETVCKTYFLKYYCILEQCEEES